MQERSKTRQHIMEPPIDIEPATASSSINTTRMDMRNQQHPVAIQKLTRLWSAPITTKDYVFVLAPTPEPKDFELANQHPGWRQAMKEDYDSLIFNGTWSLSQFTWKRQKRTCATSEAQRPMVSSSRASITSSYKRLQILTGCVIRKGPSLLQGCY